MVGFELLGTPQRDITAESAAARLREQPASIIWNGPRGDLVKPPHTGICSRLRRLR